MATTTAALERSVKRAVQTELGKHKPDAYWIKATNAQASGTPDLLICYRGVFIGMELKRPGEAPTEIQKQRLTQIVRAGGIACVVTNAYQARQLFENIDYYLNRAWRLADMPSAIAIELPYVWRIE